MPTFFYRAYGPNGELAQGQIEAASERAVGEVLSARRLVPFEVEASAGAVIPWWKRDIVFSKTSFSRTELAWFTREFATLAAAGIPLTETLRIAVEQAASGAKRSIVEQLLSDVLDGASLSDAMNKRLDSFPLDYISVVRAGEASGALAGSLNDLANLLERRMEMRARIQSALVYPAILVVLSVASLAIIIGVLVPNIAPIFREGGKEIPGSIAMLLLMHDYWRELLAGLASFAVIIIGAGAYAWRKPKLRLTIDRFMLRLPMFGAFLLKQETARYTRTLGTLLKAGVPLLRAAVSAAAVVKNRAIAAAVSASIEQVREGVSLHAALNSHAMLPSLALRMIAIGERSAALSEMLLRVAAIFEQQTQRGLDRFMAFFTPAITLSIALVVGMLIVTIMNAILSLNDLAVQ
jgi:general secretion pathway protein F